MKLPGKVINVDAVGYRTKHYGIHRHHRPPKPVRSSEVGSRKTLPTETNSSKRRLQLQQAVLRAATYDLAGIGYRLQPDSPTLEVRSWE
jgi:hypothetical protein